MENSAFLVAKNYGFLFTENCGVLFTDYRMKVNRILAKAKYMIK
jgi:hypothetical protein